MGAPSRLMWRCAPDVTYDERTGIRSTVHQPRHSGWSAGRRHHGKAHGEGGRLALHALHSDRAAVLLDDVANTSQPDARATDRVRDVARPIVGVEDPVHLRGRDAGAVVG